MSTCDCCLVVGNVVQNCGFESGVLSPWTGSGSYVLVNFPSSAHSGSYFVSLGAGLGPGTISQIGISTPVSGTYQLLFYVASSSATQVTVMINGVQYELSYTLGDNTYQQLVQNFQITSEPSTSLSISSVNTTAIHIDDISIAPLSGPCFHGKSKVLTRNTKSLEIAIINADEVLSNIHEVYSINQAKFVPIIYNIVTGPNIIFMLIKKDIFGENHPSDDLYITPGHPIIINGKEIESQNIPQAIKIHLEASLVYTICIEKREPISINGLPVLSWSLDEWLCESKKHNIIWYDNGNSDVIYNLQ